MTEPTLTDRYTDALHYAARLHYTQLRKGTKIPCLSHLLAVSSLVLEGGGDEDEAIAALLHDGPEDQGGLPVLEEIRQRFGDRVADIVAGCTDTYEEPKPPWSERKKAYIAHIAAASPSVRRVSVADKLHNARAILIDYRAHGEALWERFNAGRGGVLWYYRSLVTAFSEAGGESPLLDELDRTVTALESAAGLTEPAMSCPDPGTKET